MLVLPNLVQAQLQENHAGKVSVKYGDGSFFIGEVVRWETDHLFLKLSTLDTIKLNRSFIKNIKNPGEFIWGEEGRYHFKKGFFVFASLGLSPSNNHTSQSDIRLGWRKNKKWSHGLGFGSARVDAQISGIYLNHRFTPVYAYSRYYLSNSGVRPYVHTSVGYGFLENIPWQDTNGGLYFSPAFGIHLPSRGKVKWHFIISQYMQNTTGGQEFFDNRGFPVVTRYDLWLNRTVIKIGLEFY